MTYVIAYDVEDDRVRARLAKFLEKEGVRLQKSVFLVDKERHAFKGFRRRLEALAGEGEVAIFPLCLGCRRNALRLGEKRPRFYVF